MDLSKHGNDVGVLKTDVCLFYQTHVENRKIYSSSANRLLKLWNMYEGRKNYPTLSGPNLLSS